MEEGLSRDWLTKEEAEAFIGKNSSFYLNSWKSNPDTFLKGWNWAALFFGIEWMAYRRMYREAILLFLSGVAVSVTAALALAVFGIGSDGSLIGNILRILIGVLGNALYRKKGLRTLKKTGNMGEAERLEYLKAKGGVSILGVFGCIALEIVWILL